MSVMVQKMHINLPTHPSYQTPAAAQSVPNEPIPHVAILQISDSINSTDCNALICRAEELRANGQSTLLLDLRRVSELSSTGLWALRTIVALYAGETATGRGTIQQLWRWLRRPWRSTQEPTSSIKLFGMKPHIRTRLERAALPLCDSLITALMAA